jgi:hypothetical protein
MAPPPFLHIWGYSTTLSATLGQKYKDIRTICTAESFGKKGYFFISIFSFALFIV